MLTTVAIASIIPVRGVGAEIFDWIVTIAIGFLFFLYGARISTADAIAGLKHWRLHALVFSSTFILFPILGLLTKPLQPHIMDTNLWQGVMFLCCLPATVQSSIAFTSVARGNIPAAICSAAFSNILGIAITPILVTIFLFSSGEGVSASAVGKIVAQLLVPFVAGQIARRWIGGFVTKHKKVLGYVDRGSILLVVYSAFSAGMVAGIWSQLGARSLSVLAVIIVVLLALVITINVISARKLGFNKEDEIAIVFCGSKKSLASGVPMATVLFPAASVGIAVLPLMIFHQLQLMVCAAMAQRYAARAVVTEAEAIGISGAEQLVE